MTIEFSCYNLYICIVKDDEKEISPEEISLEEISSNL